MSAIVEDMPDVLAREVASVLVYHSHQSNGYAAIEDQVQEQLHKQKSLSTVE